MCLFPKLIPNPAYKPNKKNGGNPPICDDPRKRYIPASCGKCIECRQKKTREWRYRLEMEFDSNPIRGKFVTLTFSDEALDKLPKEPDIAAARALDLFRKRWEKKFGPAPRYWFKPELGHEGTERLHLHGIMWVMNPEDIEEVWGYGNAVVEPVNSTTFGYVTKYINKPDKEHGGYIGKVFASKGIGWQFANTATAKRYQKLGADAPQYVRLKNGQKIDIPYYMRRKIFDEETRAKQWAKLLDQQTRYVRGQKINVSTIQGWQEYFEAIRYEQAESIKMGYPRQPWAKKKYIETRKKLGENLEISEI